MPAIERRASGRALAGSDTVPPVSVDVVTGYLAAFSSGDADAVASFVSDDFVNEHLAELGSGCVGAEEYRRRLEGFLRDFAGAAYDLIEIVTAPTPAGGSTVVVRYRFRATWEGTPIDVPGMMWFTVIGGRITKRTDLWDSLTFLRQTGHAD